LYGFVSQNQKLEVCKGVKVKIDNKNNNHFVDEDEVRDLINRMGYHLEGQQMGEIDLKAIEYRLRENPSVQDAQVYATIDCAIQVEIEERNPIARVYNPNGTGFYIDENGKLMPLSNKFTARVILINGKRSLNYAGITSEDEAFAQDREFVAQLHSLAGYIHRDQFWKSLIAQIYIEDKGEVTLIPKVGKQKILFGKVEDFEDKFGKLKILYEEGFSKTGWNEYTSINLKYDNQVICSK
jgi:cell division protein FtsQ